MKFASYPIRARIPAIGQLRLPTWLQPQLRVWTFLSAILLCGFIFGGIVAGQLGNSDALALTTTVLHIIQAIKDHSLASGSDLWWNRIVQDGELLALIWVFGISLLGVPLVIVALFLRAFSIGFAIGFTTLQFGAHGLLVSSVGIFLHQLLSLCAFVIAGGIAIQFSLQMLKDRLAIQRIALRLVRYTLVFVGCFCLLMAADAFQAFVVPHLLMGLVQS